jgi:phosphohistidine swiveling domain-containing protein
MIIRSKANTLIDLRFKLKKAKIPYLKIYQVKKFLKNNKEIINDIKLNFKSKIVIRSSSKQEDTKKKSNAGKYQSYLNVNPKKFEDTNEKIKHVIQSYKSEKYSGEFFVQDMVKDIYLSGVVLTRNLEDYAPCYNINYYIGKDSSNVTSGKKGTKSITFIENKKYKIDPKFQKLLKVIKELEVITNKKDLDIEFIIDKKEQIYIVQVRDLIVHKKFIKYKYEKNLILEKLEKKIKKLKQKHYSLYGNTTYFGVMPDWNPAEIIGVKPKPLALSLYRELITDHIWSDNRKIYGYRDLGQFHLMTTFYGTPYIDVRIDFNSWLPSSLPHNLSKKLINYYLTTFKNKKYLHDKIEFEIVFTCISLTTKEKIKKRLKKLLNNSEKNILLKNLMEINKNAVKQIDKDFNLINELIKKQELIQKSSLYYIDKIYWLTEDCKKYGTLPFAGLARCGFIATEILNSFVEKKIFSENDKLKFLASIKTITSEMQNEMGESKKLFLKKFGHLRPGTYEITSLNYNDDFDRYFHNYEKNRYQKKLKTKKFIFSKLQINKIDKFINETKIYKNFDELIGFIVKSIKYREYSKFIFSKSIDLIFKNLEMFGHKFLIKKDDLSYLKIFDILDLYSNLSDNESIKNIKKHIKENKIEYTRNKNINLPDIILETKDLFIQKKIDSRFSFISNKMIIGKILDYKKAKLNASLNSIICIENADPGYDFLFSKNIKGLITKYGGQNSHMAIRCAELNLPALIGVGEENYNKIINSKSIKIDCVLKKIELIN